MSVRSLVHLGQADPSFQPGWIPGGGNVVISQPKLGCEVIHVVWKLDGKLLYDQILRAERPGVVFLPVANRKIGLQQAYRPQSRDQKRFADLFPQIDIHDLGRSSWELPRGFGRMNEGISDTLAREVAEETGGQVVDFDWLPPVCDNTAFSPHLTKVATGNVDLVAEPEDSPFEPILQKLTWFSRNEIVQMQREGELYCSYTLAAIGSYLLLNPMAIV